jgi:hypothetical protein
MKLKYKHIIAFNLMLLMLLSTIGFNIISTFCHGCEEEHTQVRMLTSESPSGCHCCASATETISCCSINYENEERDCEHEHNTKAQFARLDYEATEAKANIVNFDIQTLSLLFFILTEFITPQGNSYYPHIIKSAPPPLQGRTILALKCVLRN